MKIINKSYTEVTHMDVNSMSEDMHKQKVKKAAIVILISLTSETEKKAVRNLKLKFAKRLRNAS